MKPGPPSRVSRTVVGLVMMVVVVVVVDLLVSFRLQVMKTRRFFRAWGGCGETCQGNTLVVWGLHASAWVCVCVCMCVISPTSWKSPSTPTF